MNIQVNSAASVAGAPRAAARGGEADAKAAEALRQQATADAPAGKKPDSPAVDAGDQTDDRDGHGQQVLDVFERRDQAEDDANEPEESQPSGEDQVSGQDQTDGGCGGQHLDLQA